MMYDESATLLKQMVVLANSESVVKGKRTASAKLAVKKVGCFTTASSK
jgi:hypothetical protein